MRALIFLILTLIPSTLILSISSLTRSSILIRIAKSLGDYKYLSWLSLLPMLFLSREQIESGDIQILALFILNFCVVVSTLSCFILPNESRPKDIIKSHIITLALAVFAFFISSFFSDQIRQFFSLLTISMSFVIAMNLCICLLLNIMK